MEKNLSTLDEYYSIRDQIKTGDDIFWNSKGVTSNIIRLWSDYSHVSVVVRLEEYQGLKDRVFMVEALSHGLQFTLLSDQLKEYKGEASWMSVGLTEEQQDISRCHALLECSKTTGYDYKGLVANIFGRISMDSRNYICSEFSWFNKIKTGRVKKTDKVPRPGDIAKWMKLTPILFYSNK